MLTCKQVSRALAEQDYQDMSFWRKVGLRAHVFSCCFCGKFNRNIMLFQDMARGYRNFEEQDTQPAPDDAKQKWQKQIQQEKPTG